MKYVVYFANNQKEEVVEEEGINNLTLRCMHTKMPRKKVEEGRQKTKKNRKQRRRV